MGFSLKNIGSRIWDQVNPLDNGRSWQTRTPTYTGSAASQIRDVFDANSAQDQRRRVQQTPIPYRVPQNYREEQIMKGNLRPYENFGEQIFGNTSKFLNTAEYGRNALEETVRGQIADWTGNDSALNSSLKRQADIRKKWANPDSGVLGAGTIFNSDKEMMDLGNAEIAKRVAGNTLGTASEIIPFAKVTRPVTIAGKGAQVLWKGGKPVTSSAILAASAAERGASGVLPRVGMNAAIDSTTGAAESVARQYAQTGKVDPGQVLVDTATNTLMGQTQVAGGELWKAGKRNYTPLDISGSVPNSTNPDVPMQEATDAAKKIVDGEPTPKTKAPKVEQPEIDTPQLEATKDSIVTKFERDINTGKMKMQSSNKQVSKDRYSIANSDIARTKSTGMNQDGFTVEDWGGKKRYVSLDDASPETKMKVRKAEAEYEAAKKANNGTALAAKQKVNDAYSDAINDLNLQDYATTDSGTRTFNSRYNDWLETKYKDRNVDTATIKDMAANPQKYRQQFEAETSQPIGEVATQPTSKIPGDNELNKGLNELSGIRKQYANDQEFFDKVILENQDAPGKIGEFARHIARRDATEGSIYNKNYLTEILDDELAPVNTKLDQAMNLTAKRDDLAKSIRDLERSTGQKGLYQQVAKNMQGMTEQQQVDYMGKALIDMRDSGVLAMDYVNKQSGYKPSTPTPKKSIGEVAIKQADVETKAPKEPKVQPKVSLKEQADKLAADIDAKAKKSGRRTTFAEEKKIAKAYEEAGVDPATVPAGENMYRPPTKKSPYYTDVTMKDPSRWQRFWQSTNGIISQYGDIGKATADKIHNMRRTAEIKKAQFFNQIPNVQSLSKDEFTEFVDVLNNPKTKGSAKVQAAVKEWNGMITQVLKDAREAGIDMGDLGPNYFPRIYKDINKNEGYSRLIETIMKEAKDSGNPITRQQAMVQATFMRKSAVKKYGNLEKSRNANVGGYEKNHEAITEYIERAYGRITRAKEFGADDEVLKEIKANLMEQGYDVADDSVFSKFVNIARNDVDRSTGGWKASNVLRKVNAVTSLSSAAISNATQLTNTASVAGIGRTLKAMPKVALKKLGPDAWGAEARKLAAESGVALDHQIASVTENQLGAKGKITRNIASPFFATVEKFNREVSAIVGADWGDSLARKAANGDVNAEKLLREKLGVTGPIKDGVLSNSQKIEAGSKLVEISQFKVDPMDMPGWVETPLGKLAMQFRSFGYKQTGFMYNEVLREAAKGNVAPLARFVAVAVPAGYMSGKAKDFVQGKMFGPDKGEDNRSDGKKAVDIVAGGINNVGGFGLPGSVATSTARGIEYDNLTNSVISTVAGPTFGKAATLIDNIQKGEQDGNWKPLVKQGVSSVPAVGKTAANVLMPSEQTPEPKRDSNGKAVGDLTPKQIKEETDKEVEELENRDQLDFNVKKLSDGRIAYTIPGDVDIHYAKDQKDYREKSSKAMFELSGESSKIIGDRHYFRDQYNEVKSEPKFKYEYDKEEAANRLAMDIAKDTNEDYAAWNEVATKELKNLERLRDNYNKEGQKDEVDRTNLKIENLKQQMKKYAGYGGSFDKPKKGRSGGGGGGSSGGSGNYESPSKYRVSISTATTKFGGAPKAAPKVAGSARKGNTSKPRVTIKKSKV